MPALAARRSTLDSGCPCTNSRAMKYWPFTSPKSKTWAMLPWLSPAATRASLTNISTKSGSSAKWGRICLMTQGFVTPAAPVSRAR